MELKYIQKATLLTNKINVMNYILKKELPDMKVGEKFVPSDKKEHEKNPETIYIPEREGNMISKYSYSEGHIKHNTDWFEPEGNDDRIEIKIIEHTGVHDSIIHQEQWCIRFNSDKAPRVTPEHKKLIEAALNLSEGMKIAFRNGVIFSKMECLTFGTSAVENAKSNPKKSTSEIISITANLMLNP